ncbi:MAG: tRNA methyltransferase [Candidatus ainarchaeum sp.]|nr:tRNA methyltransferase [Candidatus ainarchaeum sp.]
MIRLPEIFRKLKRGPQVTLPKDFGMIVAFTGVGRDSACVDAGAGSGWLAIGLGNVAKKVTSYEWRDDFACLAEENVKRAGLEKRVKIKRKNVFEGIEEEELDLVTLDLADSDKAVPHAFKALKAGGYLVGYLPHAEQVQRFVKAAREAGFKEDFAVEAIVREMLVRDAGFRPENMGLMHTAYLVFARK